MEIKKRFRVFVFGPYCEASEVVSKPNCAGEHSESIKEYAKFLRFQVKTRLIEKGFTVDFGETKEIMAVWQQEYESGNLAACEMNHAEDLCKAIVIIPASIGSICELTLFAPHKSLSEKTIAIIHKKHSGENSFFISGIVNMFDKQKGKVHYLDYENIEDCVSVALEFVDSEWMRFRQEYKMYIEGTRWEQKHANILKK